MKYFLKIAHNDLLQKCVLLLFTIFVAFSFLFCARRYFIHADASYYIGVSYLMLDGKIPFKDFNPEYTPLSFYLMCIPLHLFGKSFTYAITINYLLHFVNACLIYIILKRQKISFKWAWFGGLLFFMNCFVFEGLFYVLEPFVLLFGLLSLFFVNKKKRGYFIGAGMLCACSFLCKQYGLGFILLNIAYVIVHKNYSRHGLKDSSLIIFGFALGIAIFTISMMIQGINIEQMFSLSGASYEKKGVNGVGEAIVYLLKRISPLYIAFLIAAWNYKKVIRNSFWLVSICGVLGFILPCIVRFYVHYLLLALPFIVFLIIYSIPRIENRYFKQVYIILLLITTLRPITYIIDTDRKLICKNYRKEQEMISSKIAKYIPKNKTSVFVSSRALPLSLINMYAPPLLREYGMSNGFVDKPEKVMNMLKNSDYAILTETDIHSQHIRYTPEVKAYLATSFSLRMIQTENESYYIYTKK